MRSDEEDCSIGEWVSQKRKGKGKRAPPSVLGSVVGDDHEYDYKIYGKTFTSQDEAEKYWLEMSLREMRDKVKQMSEEDKAIYFAIPNKEIDEETMEWEDYVYWRNDKQIRETLYREELRRRNEKAKETPLGSRTWCDERDYPALPQRASGLAGAVGPSRSGPGRSEVETIGKDEDVGGIELGTEFSEEAQSKKRKRQSPLKKDAGEGDLLVFDEIVEMISSLENWLVLEKKKKTSITKESQAKFSNIVGQLKAGSRNARDRFLYLQGRLDERDRITDLVKKEMARLGSGFLSGVEKGAGTSGGAAEVVAPPVVMEGRARSPPVQGKVVVFYPPKNEKGESTLSSEQTKAKVMGAVRPSESLLKVMRVRRVRNGGVLVETSDKEGAEWLLNSEAVKGMGLTVDKLGATRPKIMIYDVPNMKEEEVKECLLKQNYQGKPDGEIKEEDWRVVKRIKANRGDRTHWVVECSPGVRNWLRREERLFVEWECCRVKDYADVTRCFHCQGYGHVAKYCKERACCSHCAGEHDRKACTKKDTSPQCGACLRFGKSAKHDVASRECPAFIRAREQLIKKTDYGK